LHWHDPEPDTLKLFKGQAVQDEAPPIADVFAGHLVHNTEEEPLTLVSK
jgi:hypothetical protein